MPIKSTISESDLPIILASYDLGEYQGFKTFANGAGQTTLLLETTRGKFVLRYYENRSEEHVSFEVQLFDFLKSKGYPIPQILKNRAGECSGVYKGKPYIIIEFIEGQHGKNPNHEFDQKEMAEVIKVVAQLHGLTQNYEQEYFGNHEVFDAAYCRKEFQKKHPHLIGTEQGTWFMAELDKLESPPPICRRGFATQI